MNDILKGLFAALMADDVRVQEVYDAVDAEIKRLTDELEAIRDQCVPSILTPSEKVARIYRRAESALAGKAENTPSSSISNQQS